MSIKGGENVAKKYVVIDTEFHHIPWAAAQKAKGLPDGDLKFRRIVETPDAAYKRVFDIEGCVRHMEECGVDMALIGLATWTDAGLDVCKIINDGQAKLSERLPREIHSSGVCSAARRPASHRRAGQGCQ